MHWVPSLQQLEEGQVGSFLQRLNLQGITSHVLFRAYIVSSVWIALILGMRPSANVVPSTLSAPPTIMSESFDHIVSKPVPNPDVQHRTFTTLQQSSEDCIAAVHLGVPVRMMRVGTLILTNPSLVHQGSTISKAYETSAFYPGRPSKLVHRFVPITVQFETSDGTDQEETFEGSDAHCVLHMLEQFDGRSIYDT